MEQEINKLLEEGTIERSEGPWAVPVAVVPKTHGTWRLCTDLQRINAVIVPDPFPTPKIEELIDRVGGAKFLTKLNTIKVIGKCHWILIQFL